MALWGWILGFVLAVCLPAQATPLPRYGAFVFSNLCWSPGSGDPANFRLIVVRLPYADMVHYEWTDGGLNNSVAERLVIGPDGKITFDFVPDPDISKVPQHVEGFLSAEGFRQTRSFDWARDPTWIPRQIDLNRKIINCR